MASPSRLRYSRVDAFTDRPFGGNPAAVVVLDGPVDAAGMQSIAAEMNLSETAFVEAPGPGGARRLRWFTPTTEVPLCGHATLATAHVLLGAGEADPLRFETASGTLTVHRAGERMRMDFPADPPAPAEAPGGLREALGAGPDARCHRAGKVWVVDVADAGSLAALAPRFTALGQVDLGPGRLGVAVTAPGGDETDFVSRFFAPWAGVDEDPVTGLAHTALTPHWVALLGRSPLRARQISRRGGGLEVALAGDRVHLTGSAVTVGEGWVVDPSGRGDAEAPSPDGSLAMPHA